jgi:hypothetical protein
MDGQVEVFFTILCDNDFDKEVLLSELLESEKVIKAIKSEYAQGARNLQITSSQNDVSLKIHSDKKVYSHIIDKNDIQDILELTEEYARSQKLLKAGCNRIELQNFTTIE